MSPLLWMRVAGVAGMLAALYGGYQYINHGGVVQGRAEGQVKFDKYKREINDQFQKASAKAAADKLEQDAKYAKAQAGYAADRARLVAILNGLRNHQVVPRDGSVPVAGSGVSPMPAKTENTGGTTPAVEIAAGIRGTAFYANAMSDTLQCSQLIEFVKD